MKRSLGWLLTRLGTRLMAFNLLLVFLPVAGILFLDTYERHLLQAQERTMVQEGRLLAAALTSAGTPSADHARRVLTRLRQRHAARLRVVDGDGRLLADSARLGPKREPGTEPPTTAGPQNGALYRIGAAPFRLLRSLTQRPARSSVDAYGDAEVILGPEIRDALDGRYGAATRVLPDGTVVLYSAIPVGSPDEPAAAVLVSRSTDQVRQILYDVRLGIFKVFLVSLVAAVALTVLVTTTIVRPLAGLRRRAGRMLDRRGRLRECFPPSARRDEIGELERALAELSGRLQTHLAFTESFARDLAHELRNPQASVRSAAERARRSPDPQERSGLLERIQADTARIERLLSDARELTRLDAALEEEPRQIVSVAEVVGNVVDGFALRQDGAQGAPIRLHADDARTDVEAAPHRLAEALENVLANAVSFSPADERINVGVGRRGDRVVVEIADRGPGLPDGHTERVFTRFFRYRPDDPHDHSGLGLAVVKAVVEAYGGRIDARNRVGGGAVFTLELPAADRD